MHELFWLLSSTRTWVAGPSGAIPNPITAAELLAGCLIDGLDPDYFLRVTREADALYISEAIKKAAKGNGHR